MLPPVRTRNPVGRDVLLSSGEATAPPNPAALAVGLLRPTVAGGLAKGLDAVGEPYTLVAGIVPIDGAFEPGWLLNGLLPNGFGLRPPPPEPAPEPCPEPMTTESSTSGRRCETRANASCVRREKVADALPQASGGE